MPSRTTHYYAVTMKHENFKIDGTQTGRIDANKPNKSQPPKRGALVEDETVVGTQDGGVVTRQPDGKIDEGATDRRENR